MYKRLAIALSAALVLGLQVRATPTGVAQFVSETKWQQNEDWFGGFSAIEVLNDGRKYIALTDHGRLVQGRMVRENQDLQSVKIDSSTALNNSKGIAPKNQRQDTEGLAVRRDGQLFISLEGIHQVRAYARASGNAMEYPRHADFAKLQDNGSLEALAIDDRNRLYTLPESSATDARGMPVYRLENGVWSQPFFLSRSRRYEPVGADFGPDGKFYLLERKFTLFGFRSRIRSFVFDANGVASEQAVLETAAGEHDNLEGLSVWRDDTGALRLTMVSDDNFMFFQSTEIVEYLVPGKA
ncbi:esterase-like activity of phytase family protein [Cognatishimia sp. WU-CL00825]|uniref:esterase-like activity of phytase family protein n=1 Tax=Cognatishimia sp. WU-CL00825 TaxID=3127658 RepID=UPI00310587E4